MTASPLTPIKLSHWVELLIIQSDNPLLRAERLEVKTEACPEGTIVNLSFDSSEGEELNEMFVIFSTEESWQEIETKLNKHLDAVCDCIRLREIT